MWDCSYLAEFNNGVKFSVNMRYFPRNSIILCHFFVLLFWGAKKDTKLSLYSVFMATTVKILFDRKAKASKTSNGTVEIEVYSDGVRRRYSVLGYVVNRSGEIKLFNQ